MSEKMVNDTIWHMAKVEKNRGGGSGRGTERNLAVLSQEIAPS